MLARAAWMPLFGFARILCSTIPTSPLKLVRLDHVSSKLGKVAPKSRSRYVQLRHEHQLAIPPERERDVVAHCPSRTSLLHRHSGPEPSVLCGLYSIALLSTTSVSGPITNPRSKSPSVTRSVGCSFSSPWPMAFGTHTHTHML